MKPRSPKSSAYVPRGQPYVPGRRIDAGPSDIRSPQVVALSPVVQRPETRPPVAEGSVAEGSVAQEPATRPPITRPPVTQPPVAPSADLAKAAAPPLPPAKPEVVLFGGDPKAHETREPPPPEQEPPKQATATGFIAALRDSRWWVLLPACIALIAVGLIRLHKGPSVRTKDGVTIDLVSDDKSGLAAIALIEETPDALDRKERSPAPIALLRPGTGGYRSPAARTLDPLGAGRLTAAADIAHVGAVPRRGLCTYFKADRPKVADVVKTPDDSFGAALADAAEAQLRDLVIYDDEYRTIKYPGGDVAPLYGVCSDVVVRAYRALGIDLQARVHKARVGSSDTSIAHRRTETLRRYFKRVGASLPVTDFAEDYLPGDIVTYDRPQNRGAQDHIAIVSNMRGPSGRLMIVHNRGYGPQIEDALFVDPITGHYRFNGEVSRNRDRAGLVPGRSRDSAEKNSKRAEKDRARAKAASAKSAPKS